MEPWLQLPHGLSSTNPLPTPQGEQPKVFSVLPVVLSSQNESHSSKNYRVSWGMDLPRREALLRALFLRVFMCFTLHLRNPQALLLHTMLRRGTRTQFLPFCVITCSGLSGKEGFSTSVPHSAAGFSLKKLPVLAAQWAQNPGITALILIYFLKNTVIKNCLLLEG